MKLYPIIFGPVGGPIVGNGFIAHVQIRGRCLLEETDKDFVSILGVNPGAVAGDGSDSGEAYRDFIERVRLIIFDLADEASDYQTFKQSVDQFVRQTNRPNEKLWKAAVERVRNDEIDLEGVRREDADSDYWARIELLTGEAGRGPGTHPLRSSLNEPAGDFKIASGF